MATASVRGEFDELVTCAICFYKMSSRDPRMLPCGHVYCLGCISKTYETKVSSQLSSKGHISCPICRVPSPIPRGSIKNLKKFKLGDKVEKYSICGQCFDYNVIAFCFGCSQMKCTKCAQEHTADSLPHVTIGIQQDTIQSLLCTTHGAFAKDFCVQCCTSVCSECHISSHKGHIFGEFVINNNNVQSPRRHTPSNKYAKLCQKLRKLLDDSQHQVTETETEIDAFVNEIVIRATEQGQALKAQLRSQVTQLTQNVSDMERTMTDNPDVNLEQPLPGVRCLSLAPLSTILNQSFPVMFVPAVEAGVISIGNLKPRDATSLSNHMRDSRIMSGTIYPPESASSLKLLMRRSDVAMNCLAFMPNGDILGVTSRHELICYNEDAQRLKLEHNIPFDVDAIATHHTTGAMVVTSRQESQFAIVVRRNKIWEATSHAIEGTPECVTFTTEGALLIGCSLGEDNWCVKKFSNQGGCVWRKDINRACRRITAPENIVISGDGVHIYTPNLDKILTIDDDDADFIPCAACTDFSGRLYLVDWHRDMVRMYDSDGEHLTDLSLGINHPAAVRECNMYMAISKGHKLAMCYEAYDRSGKVMHDMRLYQIPVM